MKSFAQQQAEGLDPRLMKFEAKAQSVVLTHESVGPSFIAMWMAVQLSRAQDYVRHHGEGQAEVERWERMLFDLRMMYPET